MKVIEKCGKEQREKKRCVECGEEGRENYNDDIKFVTVTDADISKVVRSSFMCKHHRKQWEYREYDLSW